MNGLGGSIAQPERGWLRAEISSRCCLVCVLYRLKGHLGDKAPCVNSGGVSDRREGLVFHPLFTFLSQLAFSCVPRVFIKRRKGTGWWRNRSATNAKVGHNKYIHIGNNKTARTFPVRGTLRGGTDGPRAEVCVHVGGPRLIASDSGAS